MPHEDELEELNKQRIALGLKPLTNDTTVEDSPEKRAEDNYAKQRQKEAEERERKYVHLRLNFFTSLTCGILHILGGSRME